MEEAFLTTEEVLEYLRVDVRTVYRMIKAGQIPAVRVGRQWRFRKSDLDAWLERRRTSRSETARELIAIKDQQRVLIVEDERNVREILSRALLLAGYDCDAVPDGQRALQLLLSRSFDLLIIDLSLPDMDGLSIVREAQKLDPSAKTIIITGHSSEQAAIEAANLEVKAYLTKPFRTHHVLMKVAKVLGD